MKYLLKRMLEERYTNNGNAKRKIFQLDPEKWELIETGETDIQKVINSYKEQTNYKNLIEKLHSPEDIEKYFQPKNNAQYADVTMIPDNYLETKELVNSSFQILEQLKQESNVKKEVKDGDNNAE